MSWGVRRGVLLGFALLAAAHVLAQEDLAARVKKAHEAARANAASPEGREWIKGNSPAAGRLMTGTAQISADQFFAVAKTRA